ncbi:class I SAM-dependent methyltransferase [Nocardia sp. NPDC048505]|uniref:class I SAM-dependent methyltransferase n=1 Tax=unclassified Nocardia TaxID=2637762 RepID=UPI0033C5F943
MVDPMHFEQHAEVYDRARPPYPDALWQRLRELELLGPGVRVIEFGAGNGLATGPMLGAGAHVTAVEPGAALAERLRTRWPAAVVVRATAETAALPPAAFYLAVAATAVHWFDLEVLLPRLHRALTPGGHFAVWRNAFGDPAVPRTPFRERVARIVARREPGAPQSRAGEFDTELWVDRMTRDGYFTVVLTDSFAWSITLDADRIHDLFTTFSDWSAAEVDAAAEAVRELGGEVVEHYRTPLIVLRRA